MLARRAVLAAPLVLAACAGQTPLQTISIAARDAGILANGLSRALTQIAALNLPAFTPVLAEACQKALAIVQTAATALATVGTIDDAQPLVLKITGAVNSILGALALVPLPPDIKTALVAATILLPVIETAVNLVVSNAPAGMSSDQARTLLRKP